MRPSSAPYSSMRPANSRPSKARRTPAPVPPRRSAIRFGPGSPWALETSKYSPRPGRQQAERRSSRACITNARNS
jgi:hypothetical protein